MKLSNLERQMTYEISDDKIRFYLEDISTGWLNRLDSFAKRITSDKINSDFSKKHLIKEIEIKNRLDEGLKYLENEKFPKAIECFDDVIWYDSDYGEALLFKSKALKGQKHYVKSLRNYKRAIKADDSLRDIEYHKSLLKLANEERSNFPKLKLNIYAGDEHFAKGEFEKAVDSYNKALVNPSKFKDKILFKLLNKKATALLKLDRFDEALMCFSKSLEVRHNDYAVYGLNCSRFKLGLSVDDEFKKSLGINKKQALNQIMILNKLGLFKESLMICNEILDNHFTLDELYFKMNECRYYSLSKL